MENMLVVVLDSEKAAHGGLSALKQLDEEGRKSCSELLRSTKVK